MLDSAGGGSAAVPEPAVTVLGGPSPGARLLRPTTALDDTAGRALQRVAADTLAFTAPLVLIDVFAVDTVTADGVAALVVVAETAGEADIGLPDRGEGQDARRARRERRPRSARDRG